MTRVSTHTLHGVVPSNYEGLKSLLGPSGVLKDAGSHERPLGRAAAELGLQSLIIISSSTPHPRRHRGNADPLSVPPQSDTRSRCRSGRMARGRSTCCRTTGTCIELRRHAEGVGVASMTTRVWRL